MVDEPVAIIAILLLVIKELISFLKERRDAKWDGKTERRGANIEEVNNSIQLLVLPILNKQTDILTAIEKTTREQSERMLNMNYTMTFGITGLKENQEKMRANLHALNGDAQTAMGMLENIQRLVQSNRRN